MKAPRARRWDLVVGGAASLVAISGISLSITVGNTTSVGFGNLNGETQKFLVVLAGIFLILIAIKAVFRYRKQCDGR